MRRWVAIGMMVIGLGGVAVAQPAGKPAAPTPVEGALVVFENREARRANVIGFTPCGQNEAYRINGRTTVRVPAGERQDIRLPTGCYVAFFGRAGLSFNTYTARVRLRPQSEGYLQIASDREVRWVANPDAPAGPEFDAEVAPEAADEAPQADLPTQTPAERYSALSTAFSACSQDVFDAHVAGQPLEQALSLGAYADTAAARLDDDSRLAPGLGLALVQFQAASQSCYTAYSDGLEALDGELADLVDAAYQQSNARAQALIGQEIGIGAYLSRRESEIDAWTAVFSRRASEVIL